MPADGINITSRKNAVLDAFGVTDTEVHDFIANDIGLYGIDRDRISTLLYIQLACALKYGSISTFSVTDKMQLLEGVRRSTALREEPFKHPPLKGLWKTHYIDARFIATNMAIEALSERNFRRTFDYVSKLAQENGPGFDWQGRLAHELTVGAYERRAQRKALTGEWLIYAKNKCKNYYLCICTHSSNRLDDEAIYNCIIENCSGEFPFLTEPTLMTPSQT